MTELDIISFILNSLAGTLLAIGSMNVVDGEVTFDNLPLLIIGIPYSTIFIQVMKLYIQLLVH